MSTDHKAPAGGAAPHRADRNPATPTDVPVGPAGLQAEFVAMVENFDDSKQEWRRLFSEFIGTFMLVLVAAGGGMMSQAFPDTISRSAAVVAPGLCRPQSGRQLRVRPAR